MQLIPTFLTNPGHLTLSSPGGEGGSAHADFSFWEFTCNLSNTYKILPLLLKCNGEQDSVKKFCQEHNLWPWQPNFRRHIIKFKIFFLLISYFFKIIANSLSQSQEIDIFSWLICFARNLWRHRYCTTPFLKSKKAAKYFALCQNVKLFLVDVRLKTLERELKRI